VKEGGTDREKQQIGLEWFLLHHVLTSWKVSFVFFNFTKMLKSTLVKVITCTCDKIVYLKIEQTYLVGLTFLPFA
jgi:hypothetical protein